MHSSALTAFSWKTALSLKSQIWNQSARLNADVHALISTFCSTFSQFRPIVRSIRGVPLRNTKSSGLRALFSLFHSNTFVRCEHLCGHTRTEKGLLHPESNAQSRGLHAARMSGQKSNKTLGEREISRVMARWLPEQGNLWHCSVCADRSTWWACQMPTALLISLLIIDANHHLAASATRPGARPATKTSFNFSNEQISREKFIFKYFGSTSTVKYSRQQWKL